MDDLKKIVRESYPFPIAHKYKKTSELIENNMLKLKYILETAETTIQFLAIIALAQVRQDMLADRIPKQGDLEENNKDKHINQPVIWKMVTLVLEIMKAYYKSTNDLIVTELFDFCFQESSDFNVFEQYDFAIGHG
jgi:hypothetical protein